MIRYLVDDGAFAALPSCPDLATVLSDLHELLFALQRNGETAGMTTGWATVRVGDTDLGTFLNLVEPAAFDAAQLAMVGLDRCTPWDTDPELVVDPAVRVDESLYESYAVARCADVLRHHRRVVACVTLGGGPPPGLRAVGRGDDTSCPVPFLVSPIDRRHAYRRRLEVEAQGETEFFALVQDAFPDLRFAEGVTFRRLDGSFVTLKDAVVAHLTAINDHFLPTYRAEAGDLRKVGTQLGIDMSIEGATRGSDRLMRMRDAVFDGRTYRCEIHSKIERHRNRIHFHPGDEHSGGCVVIGILVDHLPT